MSSSGIFRPLISKLLPKQFARSRQIHESATPPSSSVHAFSLLTIMVGRNGSENDRMANGNWRDRSRLQHQTSRFWLKSERAVRTPPMADDQTSSLTIAM